MSIAIDVAIILVVAFAAWRGFKNGLIRGVFGVLAIIIAIYGANLVAKTYSSEFTGMLEPFVSGVVDKAVANVTKNDAEEPTTQVVELTAEEKTNVFSVSFAALRDIGVAKEAAKLVAEKVGDELSVVGQQMSTKLTEKLCSALSYIAVFGLAFIIIAIIFAVVGNIINLAFSIPGIDKLDKLAGMVFGVFKGLLIVYALAVVVRYIGLSSSEAIEKTVLLQYILNVNPLANILGI